MGDKAPQIACMFFHSDIYRLGGEKPAPAVDRHIAFDKSQNAAQPRRRKS